jgi:hypothetical protein
VVRSLLVLLLTLTEVISTLRTPQSGKFHFGYIYGFGALGCACIFVLLNLMSEQGIDFYKTVSILGYCMLPMVLLAGVSVVLMLRYVFHLSLLFLRASESAPRVSVRECVSE